MADFKHLMKLKENTVFTSIMKKLILGEPLEEKHKSFLLSSSLLIMNYLQQNKNNQQRSKEINKIIDTKTRLKQEKDALKKLIIKKDEEKSLLELAYYIVVRYSTHYKDYDPLYDFSVNLGYYPISRFIHENIWVSNSEDISLNHIFSDIHISQYEDISDPDNIKILTYNQKNSTDSLLNSNDLYKAYIAPTSYGKSEFISQIIKNSNAQNIAIISPTKILVRQNANSIKQYLQKNTDLKYRIIYHHEMYQKNTKTIASFTQERGLRFLKENPEQFFDYIIIDEAHELFKNESRNHLLEIFKQKNNLRHILYKHTKQQVLFLSPVVEDPKKFENPTIKDDPQIFGKKIKYSLKELDIYYYLDKKAFKYNRFLDELYEIPIQYQDEFNYINQYSLDKNLIFITSPRDLESYSQKLAEHINITTDPELQKLSDELANEIHQDFYMVNSIKKGIVYLHGPLPDDIREYIADKFKKIDSLKYLIANSVVLSGINFPIDNLFIKSCHAHGKNDIINLIGRINRLQYVFDKNNKDLNKLLSPVHFIDKEKTNKHGKVSYPLKSKMEHLRSLVFYDEIKNDLLKPEPIQGKIEKIKSFIERKEKYDKNNLKKQMILNAKERDENEALTADNILYLLYLYDLQDLYQDPSARKEEILQQIQNAKKISNIDNLEQQVFDLLYFVFFTRYSSSNDIYGSEFAILRLRREKARNYYIGFLRSQRFGFKDRIEYLFKHYKTLSKSHDENDYITYIGEALGEISRPSLDYPDPNPVFINVKQKSDKTLINIAISKINIEDEYVSFQLHKFFGFLYDVELLSETIYNQLIYGSSNSTFISLVKQGLPMNLVHLLDEARMLDNIKIGNYNIEGNKSYINFYNKQTSDFLKFTLKQYIDEEKTPK